MAKDAGSIPATSTGCRRPARLAQSVPRRRCCVNGGADDGTAVRRFRAPPVCRLGRLARRGRPGRLPSCDGPWAAGVPREVVDLLVSSVRRPPRLPLRGHPRRTAPEARPLRRRTSFGPRRRRDDRGRPHAGRGPGTAVVKAAPPFVVSACRVARPPMGDLARASACADLLGADGDPTRARPLAHAVAASRRRTRRPCPCVRRVGRAFVPLHRCLDRAGCVRGRGRRVGVRDRVRNGGAVVPSEAA